VMSLLLGLDATLYSNQKHRLARSPP
jgi:hypothetical protein